MKMFVHSIRSLAFVTVLTAGVVAQSSGQSATVDLQKRIAELETQLKAISSELAKIKQVTATPAESDPAAPSPSGKTAAKKEPSADKKNDLGVDVGTARVTPYGTIFFNAFANSGGTNNADVPVFATPTGSGNVSASVRQTRLGLKIEGARIGKARLGAVLEGDFFGGFPSIGTGENFGIFRVRLAYAKLEWERTTVTVGQDWMVFAPLNPTSIAAAGNPQMGAAGNNWARLPQFRIERKLGDHFVLQGALLAPQTGDFATNAAFVIQPTSGAASRSPFFQGRISYANKNWFGTKKPGSIGFSGHYGRSRVFTGPSNVRNDIESTAIAVDWNFPLASRLSIMGEAFFGRDLGGFQGGVFQSYNNDFAYRSGSSLVAGGVRSIGTRGGWTQFAFTPPVLQNRIGIYGSVGIDDPRDPDLVSVSHRDWRTRNLAIAANVTYKFTNSFSIGAEFRRFQTNYFYSGRQNANHANLGAAYTF